MNSLAFPPNTLSKKCPSREVLEHLLSKWSVLIFRSLQNQTLRFSELKRNIDGVSEKMLAQTLKTLENDGFIKRTVYAEIPPKVEYALTDLGLEAAHYMTSLVFWIEDNLPKILAQKKPSLH